MAKNRKTVFKGFSYLQCDDFARYLSDMAARGWHFKEWGTGLIFEKGEPEAAVYAVEVFIDGSENDLRPNNSTLNFADYCEAAGWKLLDAKKKFCIFKRLRDDAVDIVTAEERLQNASKAYRQQLVWQGVLAVIWMFNMALRFFPTSSFLNTVFDNTSLVLAAFWIYYFVYTLVRIIWFALWKSRAAKKLAAGDTALLTDASESMGNLISWTALILLLAGYGISAGAWLLVPMLGFFLLLMVLSVLLSKFRPDAETNIAIQIVFSVVSVIVLIVATLCIVGASQENASSDAFPLLLEDIAVDAGEVENTFHSGSASVLGTHHHYSLYYEDTTLSYDLYESEHGWLLDKVWDYKLTYARNEEQTDCTGLWDAYTAYRNNIGEYYIRYADAILILDTDIEPTKEQIAAIRSALGLE